MCFLSDAEQCLYEVSTNIPGLGIVFDNGKVLLSFGENKREYILDDVYKGFGDFYSIKTRTKEIIREFMDSSTARLVNAA